MPDCLICCHAYEPFISFGRMPIANGFLSEDQFADEYFFELQVGFCRQCGMVQLAELVDRNKMFHANYPFYSSTSSQMAIHFKEFSQSVMAHYLGSRDPLVVEIGSNDGIMLQNFAEAGIHHLGIEPSSNVARVAVEKGIHTITEFFDEDLARRIVARHGQADVFLGANVMCHLPYLHSVVEGIRLVLKPKGVLIFEDPYLGDIVEKTAYDQIYDEHAFYFSESSIRYLVAHHGLEIVDVLPQSVHGGSMRYVVAHQGTREISPSVLQLRDKERRLGLCRVETFEGLRASIEKSREDLVSLLGDLKRRGKRMVGYAATSKSTTVTNYCGIGSEFVEFISDSTPLKQGKFSPGVHIPVKPREAFTSNYPDYALLFAWNHAKEIMAKEKDFQLQGGKWIVYVPRVQVVS